MDKCFLESCIDKGMSLEAIGEESGKHPSTVSYWLQRYGLRAVGADGHSSQVGLSRGELESLVDEGLTIEQIAQRLGIGDSTARSG